MKLQPFWRYFGAKWKIANKYPPPNYPVIVEPFAGAAGYALRHSSHEVILVEKYPIVAEIWRFLISATRRDIMAIPYVEHVEELPAGIPEGARHLVGFMLGAGDSRPRPKISPMVKRDGGWSHNRLASQVEHIKHWKIIEGDYTLAPNISATWFIDPPYKERGGRDRRPGARGRVRYPCGSDSLDFEALAVWCRARHGQRIVCENVGATWLPFAPLGTFGTAAPGGRSREAAWFAE